jgi:hypothetical protein
MKYCFVLLLFFITGCALEPKVAPTGPSGSVSGYAYLYSSKGIVLSSSAGITVTATGTNKSAVTDDSGKWTMTGLPAGNYTFSFVKEGYGSVKEFDFKTEGKDTIDDNETDMSQPVSDQINFQRFTISLSTLDSIASYNMIGSMEPPFLEIRNVVLCISADSAALVNDPQSAPLLLSFSMPGSGYDGGFDWSSTNALAADGKSFPHGTQLYATVFISGEGPDGEYLSNYFDPTTGKEVYTSVGRHSQVLTAIMP